MKLKGQKTRGIVCMFIMARNLYKKKSIIIYEDWYNYPSMRKDTIL